MLKSQTLPKTLPPMQSFYFDSSNAASPKTPFIIGQTVLPSTVCWLNLSLSDPNLAAYLTKDCALTKNAVESLCDPRFKSRMWVKKDAIFFSLFGFAILPTSQSETPAPIIVLDALPQMGVLNAYLTNKMLITVGSASVLNLDKLFEELQISSPITSSATSPVTPQNIVCALMAHILYQVEDTITNMQQYLVEMESHVDEISSVTAIHKIWELRKQIIQYLHHFHIQEDMLAQVFYEKPEILNDTDFSYFKNILADLAHCTNALHTTENLAMTLQAKIDSLANDAMSRKLYLLSIVALFVVPFTVISGVLGMNVHIPGQWQPYAFEYVLGGSFLLSIILFFVFRFKKWL
jgi:Mg2+ and Co2+ transporter CorA